VPHQQQVSITHPATFSEMDADPIQHTIQLDTRDTFYDLEA